MDQTKNTIIIHDGATDELMSILFAAAMPNVSIKGILVLNADCQGFPTAKVSSKLLDLVDIEHIPVAVSNARAWNPFPWTYRQYSLMVDLFPIVNQYKEDVKVPDPLMNYPLEHMVDKVYRENNNSPVTLLCLSPVTDIATAIKNDPDFSNKVDEIVWMGGVYITEKTPFGNIDTGIAPGANPNAEWNVYWDPHATQEVLKSGIKIKMFPLNVTNDVTLSGDIIREHFIPGSKQFPALDLAVQMYALVAFQYGFSFWDTAATAYLGKPELYDLKKAFVDIDTGNNPATQGTMTVKFITDAEPLESSIEIASTINVNKFYEYYVDQLKTLKFK
ncbi:nucleoside hydrolase [Winogradskyella sp.]|uniref:nucleoside hydrolase n=1 Tax=Winogradskyella sp. TaxID=1883156 RepID=UPI0025E9F84B|nr:nucleoside hydrolase [Winogradskyella sp.]